MCHYNNCRVVRMDATTKVDMKEDTPSGFNIMVTGHIESCQVNQLKGFIHVFNFKNELTMI